MNLSLLFSQFLAALGLQNSLPLNATSFNSAFNSSLSSNFSLPSLLIYSDNLNRTIAVQSNTLSCGQSRSAAKSGVSTRIVGGYDVRVGEFPWQVSLQRVSTHFCGGSIIQAKWIVTAAHCMDWVRRGSSLLSSSSRQNGINSIRVVAGVDSLKSRSSATLTHRVVKIIIHPKYNTREGKYDIALLELDTPYDISARRDLPINSLCLPSQGQEFTGMVLTTGWGRIEETGSASNSLKAVELPLVSQSTCARAYGWQFDANVMICAGETGKDSCQGDSGGPLIKRESGRATLVGITSTGNGCGRSGFPGVYTKVSFFVDWIRNSIK